MKKNVSEQEHAPDLAAVRAVRPAEDTAGWAASPAGRRVLEEVLRRAEVPPPTPGSRRRRRLLLVTGVMAAVFAGISTAAVATLGPWGKDGDRVMCARTLAVEADLSEPPAEGMKDFDPRDPARSCAATWHRMWQGTPQPTRFAACYHPLARPDHGAAAGSVGRPRLGGPVVYPADGYPTDQAACAAIGSKPVAGG
ncbi:hypothetical protein ACIP98_13470 [Streptomyces sp. NPDC088354]|uniref:hypothetical protein n=1 Tax=unclassified Streptomyces TaxID=2593676 RepID=UPI0029B06279|nr:hypothetical protein [Streptomyces sp. MI02-7b]MDX3071139.1 hypothetical protein [Streptomyces sp. MI02-7b]